MEGECYVKIDLKEMAWYIVGRICAAEDGDRQLSLVNAEMDVGIL